MRPDCVVVTSPAFDDDLGLPQRVEDFAIEQFIAQASVEALDVSVLAGATWRDVDGLRHKLRPIVRSDMTRHTAQDEEVGQRIDYIDGLELAGNPDRQTFMGELLNHVEHAILPSIVGAILNKIVGPDMIAVLGPQPDARSVCQPKPAAFGLLIGDLQPLTSPDPLDPLVVDEPARLLQQPGDLAIAVATILPGQCDEISG